MILHTRRTSLCRWQCCGFLLCFSTLRRYKLDNLSGLSLSLQMLFFVVQLLLCSIVFFDFALSSMCAAASRAHVVYWPRIYVLSCAQESGYCCREELHALNSFSLSAVICAQENPRSTIIQYVTKLLRSAESRLLVRCTTILKNWSKALKEGPPPPFQLVCTLHQETLFEVSILETWELVALQIVAQTYTLRNLFTNLGPFCGSMFLPLFPSCPHNTSTGLYFRLLFQRCCFRWSV